MCLKYSCKNHDKLDSKEDPILAVTDLGPTKTFQPNLFFFSVTNQNVNKNSPCQSETKIAKHRLLVQNLLTYNINKKKRKKHNRLEEPALHSRYITTPIDFLDSGLP
jgi:hypothetical protein